MKRIWMCLSALMILCSVIASVQAEDTSIDYVEEFDSILSELQQLTHNASYMATVNIVIWDNVGVEEAAEHIKLIREYDLSNYYSDYDRKRIRMFVNAFSGQGTDYFSYISYYQDAYDSLSEKTISRNTQYNGIKLTDVSNSIKQLRDKYESEHSNGINALKEYLIKLQSYADFVINPSGNLMSYHSNNETYKNELEELKRNAEFEK